MLVIDARELLTSTARVVGAQMGELHLKLWMALVTHHVAEGLPENAEGASAVARARTHRLGRRIARRAAIRPSAYCARYLICTEPR